MERTLYNSVDCIFQVIRDFQDFRENQEHRQPDNQDYRVSQADPGSTDFQAPKETVVCKAFIQDIFNICNFNNIHSHPADHQFKGTSHVRVREAEIQLPLKRSSRFQRLFPNPSWLVRGRASRHQKLAPTFSGIDSCLMVTKRDFFEMEASL